MGLQESGAQDYTIAQLPVAGMRYDAAAGDAVSDCDQANSSAMRAPI